LVSEDVEAPFLLILCGPTGSGKGGLARELARRTGGEVVSADSRKIYRRFDIGTAKPTRRQRREVPHHLIDVCEPEEVFTAARFVQLADEAIAGIRERGRLPVVSGGTGLYLRALLHGIADVPPRDEDLRARLLDEESSEPGILHRKLGQADPHAAAQIPRGDLVRTVRALEVFQLTGRPISSHQTSHGFGPVRYRARQIAPDWDREDLYRRIDARVENMMRAGWLEEVRALIQDGLDQSPAFQTVGYPQLKDHLAGRWTLDEAVAAIQKEHRRYARRQLTWFRAVSEIEWLPAPVDVDQIIEELEM
jgi:tRNA dimethylallyltransferase